MDTSSIPNTHTKARLSGMYAKAQCGKGRHADPRAGWLASQPSLHGIFQAS